VKDFLQKEVQSLGSRKISIFYFWLLGFTSYLAAVGIVGIIWVLSKGFDNPRGPLFQVLVDFPGVWVLAAIHFFFATIYFGVSRLLYLGKKLALVISSLFLVFIPPLYSFAMTQIPVLVNGWPFSPTNSMSYVGFLTKWAGSGILTNFLMVVILINIILAWINMGKESISPGKLAKVGYLIPPLMAVILCVGGFAYMYSTAFSFGDYHLTQVQNSVGFKLYSPRYMPDGYKLNNYYINSSNQIAGLTTVQVVIDRRFKDVSNGKKGFFIVRQAKVGSGFSLKQYVEKTVAKGYEIKNVEVRGQEAYTATKITKTGTISELFFYLDKDVVGCVATVDEGDEITRVADSMQ
jgi:hypothetical protein